MKHKWRMISILILLLTSCAHVKGGPPESKSVSFNPFLLWVSVYRDGLDHLSSVRSSECPMDPSCSAYAIECLEKHGILMGWVMALDRLMRCGRDETRHCTYVRVDGKGKCHDPVSFNDYWWNGN